MSNDNETVVVAHDADVGSIAVIRNDVDRLVTVEAIAEGPPIEITLTHAGTSEVHEALGDILASWRT